MHTKDDKEQTLLVKKLDNLLRKDPKSPRLQRRLVQLHENAHQTPTKACQRGAKQRDRRREVSAFLQHLKEEHEEWCGLRFSSHEASKRPPELQQKYPYPGMVNLGNTCYVNAVCQVLVHCDAARNCLRSGVQVPEGSPASVADDDSAALVLELQSLAQNFADGFPTELPGQRCRVDCWSPHALIDVLLRCRPLKLGKQHDAREALEEILTRTPLGSDLFDTGARGRTSSRFPPSQKMAGGTTSSRAPNKSCACENYLQTAPGIWTRSCPWHLPVVGHDNPPIYGRRV